MLALGFALVLATVAPPTTPPEQALARVQASYKQGGDFTATFSQIYVEKLRGKKKEESGRMWAKTDGRVRWTYDKPVRKDFVFTGKAAYFYEPSNSQVTVFEKFQDTPLWNALRFLWGQGQLSATFDVHVCDQSCPTVEANQVALKLTPKENIGAIDRVVVVLDTKENRVRRSIVYDPLGNRTEYAFAELKFGATIDGKKFDFSIPEGASIIHATADQATP